MIRLMGSARCLVAGVIVCLGMSMTGVTAEEVLDAEDVIQAETVQDMATTLGVLQGGGALIGLDVERMINDRWSVQIGAGMVSLGAGLNYHLKPQINSNFISIQVWNQGLFGESLAQRLVGVSYVFRGAESGFTGQLGLAYVLERSARVTQLLGDMAGEGNVPSVALIYSIGWWF